METVAIACLAVSVAVLLWTVYRLQNRLRYLSASLANVDALLANTVDDTATFAETVKRAVNVLGDGLVQHHQRIENLETARAVERYFSNGPTC